MSKFVSIILVLITFGVHSQDFFRPNHSFKVDLGLPSAQGNKPYKYIMQGLINASAYYQYTLPFGLNFGGGANLNYFTINEFRLPGLVKGGITTVGGFGKLGYEKFFAPNVAMDFGVKFGYGYSYSKNTKTMEKIGKAHEFDALYIEPMVNLYLMADEKSGFSLSIGYVFKGMKFNETHLMVDEITGYEAKDFGSNTHFLLVGFGYTYYFGRKGQSN